ncbi:hypothetical protein GCM10010401_06600 [Rarobacter faecitabidus]|uniref:Uncharacterized protein n=1 Tax=Rarobacter faecitabidus TaxID=13243 RepID=A0A542ZTA5_RARFA|nr:class II fructose-bisphosphate aldolase [Rarobacter faecitabidus]TQL63592.1 hypothetical protein FB461_0055 [Rarobacter faecitabidus]
MVGTTYWPNLQSGGLPSETTGEAWHYTSAHSLTRIDESDVMHASHIVSLNDPSELEYGLSLVREALAGDNLDGELRRVFDSHQEEIARKTAFYVLSASRNRDLLPQFRSYGTHAISLSDDCWMIDADFPSQFDERTLSPKWREVIYNRESAQAVLRRAAEECSATIWTAEAHAPHEVLRQARVAAVEYLVFWALHLKHPAYASEQEIRIVFDLSTDTPPLIKATESGSMVPYLKVRPQSGPLFYAVHLGPTANSASHSISASAAVERRRRQTSPLDVLPSRFSVTNSEIPFRQ